MPKHNSRLCCFDLCEGKTCNKGDDCSYCHLPKENDKIDLINITDDKLIKVALTNGDQDIMVGTRMGMAIRFSENDVREMGRTARGVRSIKLKRDGDEVVGMVIVSDEQPDVLSISENGYGKRTIIEEYRSQGRGGSGITNFKLNNKTGKVAGVLAVNEQDDIMVVSDKGMMIRTGAVSGGERGFPWSAVTIRTSVSSSRTQRCDGSEAQIFTTNVSAKRFINMLHLPKRRPMGQDQVQQSCSAQEAGLSAK